MITIQQKDLINLWIVSLALTLFSKLEKNQMLLSNAFIK